MSAWPFGGHPKFSEYCTWAAQDERCTVQTGFAVSPEGAVHNQTMITAPSGRHVIVVDITQDEFLMPTMIAYLDRRLGLNSKWFKLP